ncbi:MAG: hypothetical protein ACT4SY_00515 [Hyphomicrobiales bacterium]
MMKATFVQKLLAVTALAASTAISSAIALSDENGGRKAVGERGAVSGSLTTCDGGSQEKVVTNTQNAPASTFSSVFVPIPSTTIPGGPSGGDADTYTVTFSGEADATVGNWEIQAQVSVNGGVFVDMDPVGPNTFHTGTLRETHTMTWCKRLVATSGTTFRAVWKKNGGGAAIVDDYLMRVERSN